MPDHPVSKVRFKKRDIAALHQMPSSTADDRVVLRAPSRWRTGRLLLGWSVGVVLVVALIGAALAAALEAGFADSYIRERARVALAQAMGPANRADLTSAAVRLTERGQLALEARDVVVEPVSGGADASPNRVERVLISLDTMALLSGRISVRSVDVEGVGLVAPERGGFNLSDLAGLRVDGIGARIEDLFLALNAIADRVEKVDAGVFRFSDITISGSGMPLVIETASIERTDTLSYAIEVDIQRDGSRLSVRGMASAQDEGSGLTRISGDVSGLSVDVESKGLAERRNALRTDLTVDFEATRGGAGQQADMKAGITASRGALTMGGVEAELNEARINLVYMPDMNKIELTPSLIRIGETVMPFTGGLIDADRVDSIEGRGLAFDFVIRDGRAAPGDSSEAPISFDGKAFGWFDAENRLLVAEKLTLTSPRGGLFGSASWRFVEGMSPEMNLVATSQRMSTAAVKQLWPYWIGKRARQWVLDNLYGGVITDGRIALSVPAGHFPRDAPARFTEEQLQIDFDIERARMNVAGDIPPLRDTIGHMRLRGPKIDVTIASGTAFFPTGRKVEVSDARFSIPAADQRPLMAELAMSVSGDADAVAELITYHPIAALDRIGLVPEDLSGSIESDVTARFGLIRQQKPPPPDWTVQLEMRAVDIAKPVEGRSLTNMDGSLYVTPHRAELKSEADVDGARMTLDVVQPVGNSGVENKRILSGTLSAEEREVIAPGSGALISGPVGFTLETIDKARSAITLDLKPATLTVPGLGWTKGPGVAANLSFTMANEDDSTRLSGLELSGKGFKASGDVTLMEGQLASADFTTVALSPRDDYRASIRRNGSGYKIEIGGKAIDARPIIARAKNTVSGKSSNDDRLGRIEVSGSVDNVHGYSDERLTSGVIGFAGQGDRIDRLDFKAVTRSGQAVVLSVKGAGNGDTVEVTSGDAGAFARFMGIYSRIQGGLLNVRLTRQGGPLRRGAIDLRNFMVVGEPRLASLVSTPSKEDGRSLNEAVRANIDVSQARFEVADARVVSGNGELLLEDGVLRGPQIGASFRGKVHDKQGRIDLAGTFMPAYGVNRLFGELPLIGALLGNGRDRGLIGITFRLGGKTASPLLEVNPLSVVAPGVFRSIFEFRP